MSDARKPGSFVPDDIAATDEFRTIAKVINDLAEKARQIGGFEADAVAMELDDMLKFDDVNLRRFPRCVNAAELGAAHTQSTWLRDKLLELKADIEAAKPAVENFSTWRDAREV